MSIVCVLSMLDLVELAVVDRDIVALGDFIAAHALVALDDFAGFGIDILLLQAMAGLAIEEMERDALARARGGEEGDGTGDKRELQIALPVGPRCHTRTPCYAYSQSCTSPAPHLQGNVPLLRRFQLDGELTFPARAPSGHFSAGRRSPGHVR